MILNTSLNWFRADKITPVKFYPYTSIVTNHIFWLNPAMNSDTVPNDIRDTFQYVKDLALLSGKIRWDNKVVLECIVEDFPHHIFMGYKDHALVLGFSVHSDPWIVPISL